ncbi:SH3 domain and tetratricopeptide repeat-containing protein 1 [Triplophysa tibetana]|uniref:SH3 domain and tetratricopeptide repeat-containing protein 1 n=1 Tax=Triplophysa tibetana TaxID=1572043 RepID=A0A5A9PRQ1_9TELE|nr:SH3 domain and tetratricopeptide repeat-containing protein 1 [Triplophysa tibetana]
MSTATRKNSYNNGNGVEYDPDQNRSIRRELSIEYSRNESDIIMETSKDFKTSRGSVKGNSATSEDNIPTVLAMQLAMVEGPDRLPADKGTQEALSRKLCVLEADLTEVTNLISELSARLVSVNSGERTIYITFNTFEEIWKFSTYHRMGLLGRCMENLLMDQEFWLISLDQDSGIEISIKEDELHRMYKGFLMQEGSFFGRCTANQMFDSSTSGRDLYLEKGDIALFEPPFLGSGWTVLSLADGSRGTKPKPALEPVIPFHEWFLKSCPEGVLVGGGKRSSDLPFPIAIGVCETTEEYDADVPDELSFQAGENIIILSLLVGCYEWFMGKLEKTGDIGLVKTSMVKATDSVCESSEIFLKDEDRQIAALDEEKIKEETITSLKKSCRCDVGTNYKLDLTKEIPGRFENKCHQTETNNLKHKVSHILRKLNESPRNEVKSNSSKHQTQKEAIDTEASEGTLRFSVCSEQENASPDGHHALLSFLNTHDHHPEFLLLYSAYPEFLISHFQGHSDEEDIVAYLGEAREIARKNRLSWAQSRICFLLGQLCAGRSKFSQARVYFEEALSVPRDYFKDTFLLSAIYSNLAFIYLTQKNHEKFVSFSERFSAMLMAVPNCLLGCEEPEILKYVLKKAILAKSKNVEARVCFLLAKLHLKLKDGKGAIPFIERLQILADEVACDATWSHASLVLARLYSDQCLPHLAESCARRASLQVGSTVSHCLCGISLLLENAPELSRVTIPTQVAPYLTHAASLVPSNEEPTLTYIHALCLSWLFHKHSMPDRAVCYMRTFLDHSSASGVTQSDVTDALMWLAWLYICNQQPSRSLEVLDGVLSSLPDHCTTQLEGVVYNMRAIAYKRSTDIQQASESYRAAVEICEEFEDRHNWAIVLANFGFMCLQVKSKRLAEEYLSRSVELFSELEDEGHELSFIAVLLELGRHLISQRSYESGKIYYEWALLIAVHINDMDSQLGAIRQLCHLYGEVCPDEAQCIIYNEHQLNLVQLIGDKSLEGDILEKISQLYLNLGTERANRAALDYTKRSLGIYIDMGRKTKEAHAWLQAGKIYHILKQKELVDLYVQVAQDVALSTGDTLFTLELLEAAGDVFFNSSEDREKAICFYRDRALPIAVKTSSVRSQLRLCNKLSELLLQLRQFSEAIEFAQTALHISVSLTDHLNERVAFHRLATLYHCVDQFEMAEHHFLKALSLCPSPLQYDEEALYYVRVYQTLGDIIFYDLKDPFDAAGYYHLALAAAMDLGTKRSQLKLCTRLATVYHNFLMDRELSLYFYQRARVLANELHVRRVNLTPDQNFRTTAQYKNTISGVTR